MMEERELKRKLRQLKKIERIVWYGSADAQAAGSRQQPLLWDSFFSGRKGIRPRYPFEILLVMNGEARKRAFADYLRTVYTRGYREKGLLLPAGLDIQGLFDFDLPAEATREDVKKRFRELAMIVHPDHGGSNEAMAALLDQYHELMKG